MDEDTARLRAQAVFDEGREALSEQTAALEALRTRSVALLGIVGAVAAVFAPTQRWAILATAALVGVVAVLATILLLPRNFDVNTDASPLEWQPMTGSEFLEQMAKHIHSASKNREETLGGLQCLYVAAVVATGCTVLVLLVARL